MPTAFESRDFMLHYYLVLYGILYYDYFATLHREYVTMWKARWSVVKILFFVNRYLMLVESILILVGFALQWSTEKCRARFIPWQAILPVIIAGAGSSILVIRTHAIWGHARWVLYLLCPLLAAHIGSSTYLAATKVSALVFPGEIGPCMVLAKLPIMDVYCILPLVFDLVTSGLCVYRSMALQREVGNFGGSLLRSFTRHGTLYALGAAIANGTNLAFMAITRVQLGLPTVPSNGGMICTVFASILISRLAMSLRKDDEDRREIGGAMIPLTGSFRSSGTGCDMKAGQHSGDSDATYVNMPWMSKTGTIEPMSFLSKKESASFTPFTNYTSRHNNSALGGKGGRSSPVQAVRSSDEKSSVKTAPRAVPLRLLTIQDMMRADAQRTGMNKVSEQTSAAVPDALMRIEDESHSSDKGPHYSAEVEISSPDTSETQYARPPNTPISSDYAGTPITAESDGSFAFGEFATRFSTLCKHSHLTNSLASIHEDKFELAGNVKTMNDANVCSCRCQEPSQGNDDSPASQGSFVIVPMALGVISSESSPTGRRLPRVPAPSASSQSMFSVEASSPTKLRSS